MPFKKVPPQLVDIQGGGSDSGWTPVIAVVEDGNRRVLQVADWDGGTGDKPATGLYVSAAGLVSDIAEAVEIGNVTNNINNYIEDTEADGIAPVYGCRAWGNCFGARTGASISILGSGNISSVSKESEGTYLVTMETPMPDEHYAPVANGMARGFSDRFDRAQLSTLVVNASQFYIVAAHTANSLMPYDFDYIHFHVVR